MSPLLQSCLHCPGLLHSILAGQLSSTVLDLDYRTTRTSDLQTLLIHLSGGP